MYILSITFTVNITETWKIIFGNSLKDQDGFQRWLNVECVQVAIKKNQSLIIQELEDMEIPWIVQKISNHFEHFDSPFFTCCGHWFPV